MPEKGLKKEGMGKGKTRDETTDDEKGERSEIGRRNKKMRRGGDWGKGRWGERGLGERKVY